MLMLQESNPCVDAVGAAREQLDAAAAAERTASADFAAALTALEDVAPDPKSVRAARDAADVASAVSRAATRRREDAELELAEAERSAQVAELEELRAEIGSTEIRTLVRELADLKLDELERHRAANAELDRQRAAIVVRFNAAVARSSELATGLDVEAPAAAELHGSDIAAIAVDAAFARAKPTPSALELEAHVKNLHWVVLGYDDAVNPYSGIRMPPLEDQRRMLLDGSYTDHVEALRRERAENLSRHQASVDRTKKLATLAEMNGPRAARAAADWQIGDWDPTLEQRKEIDHDARRKAGPVSP